MSKQTSTLVLLIILLSFAPPSLAASAMTEQDLLCRRTSSFNGLRNICGRTVVYYAQNSPEWSKIGLADVGTVGDSMCAAAALSNVIANCVPYSDIGQIGTITRFPVRIDTHNIALNSGIAPKSRFVIQNLCDYFRFLPLCIGNYAAGNNKTGSTEARCTGYYERILNAYGLDFSTSRDIDFCIECLEEGAYVIACTGGSSSPIAPMGRHYFVLSAINSGYLYCMDSYCRDRYKYDRDHLIEIVEPGIIRVPVTRLKYLSLHGTMFIIWPDSPGTYSEQLYNQIILESRSQTAPSS